MVKLKKLLFLLFLAFLVFLSFNFFQSNLSEEVFAIKEQSVANVNYVDTDFIYVGLGEDALHHQCVLSKSLMNKFCPKFEGKKCQLIFECGEGAQNFRLYSSCNVYFYFDEKNDVYLFNPSFYSDSRGKHGVADAKVLKIMGGKKCKVHLFENNEFVKTFEVVLHKGKDINSHHGEAKYWAKKVSHLKQSEVYRFNKLTSKQHDDWVSRQHDEECFSSDEFKKNSSKLELKDLDYSIGDRKWFAEDCPLNSKLGAFLNGYVHTFFKEIVGRGKDGCGLDNIEKLDECCLVFADVKESDFYKQRAFVYFSPTWFIKKLGLKNDETFTDWIVELENDDGSVFKPRCSNVFGPFPEGDFSMGDVSICKANINDLLRNYDTKGNFNFKNGKNYKIKFFRNGKAKKKLIYSCAAKARKTDLKDLFIGNFSGCFPVFELGTNKVRGSNSSSKAKNGVTYFCFEKDKTHLAKCFAHPKVFNKNYYKNFLVKYGAREISWDGSFTK